MNWSELAWAALALLLVAGFACRRHVTDYIRRRTDKKRRRKIDDLKDDMYPLW